jgi:hypothetical protein
LSFEVVSPKLIVGNNFEVISMVKPNIPPFSHKVVANQKMEVGHTLGVAVVMAKNNGLNK